MKYILKNKCGYYKFCRKIPHTNKQFIFSLKTKNAKISKKIVSIFLIKSNHYFLYLQTINKEDIMDLLEKINTTLQDYKNQAMIEYTDFEKSRQLHFSLKNDNNITLDGSQPEPIKYWLDELSKYIGGAKSEREMNEFGKKVLKRATIGLKQLFQEISNKDDKLIFLQKLIKAEADLLMIDHQRWQDKFDIEHIAKKDNSGQMNAILNHLKTIQDTLVSPQPNTNIITNDNNINYKNKNKFEIHSQYLENIKNSPSYQTMKDKIIQPLEILIQSSEKEYLIDYDEDDYSLFFETLLYTPKSISQKKKIFNDYENNYLLISQAFRDEEEIELHHYQDLDFQTVKNLSEKLDQTINFLDDCIPNKAIDINPLKGNLKYSPKHFENVANASKERLGYEDYELKKMFNLIIENELYKTNIEHFYIIMIGFFSGMRVEEVCKLMTNEVHTENGLHYFSIENKVKNKSSIRKVPIHNYLVDKFKLLDFVKTKKPDELLFNLKYLQIGKKKKYSHYFVREFYKLRDECVSRTRVETDLIAFHSFRYTISNYLADKGIQYVEVAQILGHKIKKLLQTPGYTPNTLKKNDLLMQKLTFTDVKTELNQLEKEFKKVCNF